MTAALSYIDFSFAYAGSEELALCDVNLEIPSGAFMLVVGETGSGKTTLLRCAKPEITPAGRRSGAIALFGHGFEEADASLRFGYVFQDPDNQIVCDTVWHELAFGLENLGMDPALMRRRVAEVANFFGIESWLHQATDELSGGQKQIMNLAAILALQPDVLLLDEPTAQLDPIAQANFLHALRRVNRELGITVVVATHQPEFMLDYATAAARVEDGHVMPCALEELHLVEDPARAERSMRAASHMHGSPNDVEALKPVLTLQDVFYRYSDASSWVLRNMLLELPAGIHAIVGGNGCGKTTTLKLLAGILKPARGCVRNAFRKQQAFLPQNPKALLVCDTVREELCEWQKTAGYGDEDVARIMRTLRIESLADRHPYDASGGQQQRIALAKLLLCKPELLLLDEPTKGLDAASKLELGELLLEVAQQGATVVFVTHDLAFASRVAQSMTLLFDGEVACAQPSWEFCESGLFYKPRFDRFSQLWDERS